MVVKENTVEADGKTFDESDSSYTRTRAELRDCMLRAGFKILDDVKQKDFPKDLYPVYMFALQ